LILKYGGDVNRRFRVDKAVVFIADNGNIVIFAHHGKYTPGMSGK
jgi:hypothetical protein